MFLSGNSRSSLLPSLYRITLDMTPEEPGSPGASPDIPEKDETVLHSHNFQVPRPEAATSGSSDETAGALSAPRGMIVGLVIGAVIWATLALPFF